MWKRVHLAIVDGPDSGHVIDLGAAGRGVRAGLEVRIGSDILADVRIRDAHLPPRHLRVRAGTNRWGIRGVWVDGGDAGGARHVRVGGRYRAGATTFEARTDTTRRARRRDAGFLLPLVGAAGFAAMWALPGAGPVPILAAAAAGVALTARSRRPPLPDPARLARAGLTTAAVGGGRTGGRGGEAGGLLSRLRPGSADGTVRVDLGNTRRRPLEIRGGDVVGLAGPGAPSLARWVAAQLVAAGAQCTREATARFSLRLPGRAETAVLAVESPSLLPGHVTHALPAPAGHNRRVSEEWFTAAVDLAAGASLPPVAHLADHLPEAEDVAHAWSSSASGLRAPVAVEVRHGVLRPVILDLAGEAPHAVIAGTTGSGKSELLTTWLLGLAARYPPAHAAMVLIDYKGGATFGSLAGLPHVLEVLTDLDHGSTVRALEALEAEIRRRERALKTVGAPTLGAYNRVAARPLTRLLIAVDEFRVLADEYPAVLEQLVRVAAQGRSLGLHVILATQRPGSAMTPDIRANMGLRLCLRVVEEADSIDLVGSGEAAHLPPVPGRFIARDTSRRTAQALWAGRGAAAIVASCRAAATALPDLAAVRRPWAPPLPDRLDTLPDPADGHITLGVSDLPHEQRLGEWQVPLTATLVVAGKAGSGRTNLARLVARGLLAAGRGVHAFAHAPPLPGHGWGSFAHVTDPASCYQLLTRLAAPGGRAHPDAVIIDGAEDLARGLEEAVGPGEGAAFLTEVLRGCRARGRFILLTARVPAPAWVEGSERVVFPPEDPHEGALAGLRTRPAPGSPLGRAVGIRAGRETMIQVALAPGGAAIARVNPEFTFRPPPAHVDLPLRAGIPSATSPLGGVCIGLGAGDHRVALPIRPGEATLIVGADGGGKSRLARVIAARAEIAAREGRGGPLVVVDDLHSAATGELDAALSALESGAHVVATTTPEGLAASFHPLSTRVRHAPATIFIGLSPRSAVGLNLGAHISPGVPGRAVLRSRGQFTPVQLDWCTEASP